MEALRTLCFDLQIDFDLLPGPGKGKKPANWLSAGKSASSLTGSLKRFATNAGPLSDCPTLSSRLFPSGIPTII